MRYQTHNSWDTKHHVWQGPPSCRVSQGWLLEATGRPTVRGHAGHLLSPLPASQEFSALALLSSHVHWSKITIQHLYSPWLKKKSLCNAQEKLTPRLSFPTALATTISGEEQFPKIQQTQGLLFKKRQFICRGGRRPFFFFP